MKILPSIASANQYNIEKELGRIGSRYYENLHIDIEDGNFIPNITFGLKTMKQIRENYKLPFSVHLMVSNPESYIDELQKLGCCIIFIHVESCGYLSELLNKIKSLGIKAGIALNPYSDLKNYKYLFGITDAVMFMTSEPDFRGQIFNPAVLEGIEEIIGEKKFELWADGGIKAEHMEFLEKKQIDYVVMGREIFDREDPEDFLKKINFK
ncbi:ribulose-phosphate 3-epimerase [Sebaldella sp. S0638]|uniref:ribulose-phosphate 3-epimerase n=1 Tax=Sebaldella sp. S0638 TaxID=2957809 RepID=UPI0020A0B851|nr:ribulose-phosphate 3-epimerase [Sebaldella sp. S0638]MCP1225398.1 ribulose-phosphate 3-epimerase [Sebaldella sp. S0638]